MAGHFQQRRESEKSEKTLLNETVLWRWEEGDYTVQKLVFRTDADGFYLYAKNSDDTYKRTLIWDFVLISDVRTIKLPKEQRLCQAISEATGQELTKECCLDLVYRRDGIVHLTHTLLVAENPSKALAFRNSVNSVARQQKDAHASLRTNMKKFHKFVLLHANVHDRIPLRTLGKLLMEPKGSRAVSYHFETNCSLQLETEEGGSQYVVATDLTEGVFEGLLSHLRNSHRFDMDVLQRIISHKSNKLSMGVKEFLNFLNHTQRSPHLNGELFPPTTPEQASILIECYSGSSEELLAEHLFQYLTSEDNIVLDVKVTKQHMDMKYPLNHYFINSSHNTYLNGHQIRSESLAEMYIQVLLLGCRCLELDCWPSGDLQDIVITHGKTLCTQVSFREVLEAINEYAFVASKYPLILSVENHCTRYPQLIALMAHYFRTVFGEKLLSAPLDGYPVSILT